MTSTPEQPDTAVSAPPPDQAPDQADKPRVRRFQVLSRLTNLYPDARYLEVGVNKGLTFHQVPAAVKVAVDPVFLFDVPAAEAEHPEATYHAVTSDEYFERIVGPEERFDVIYLDGLHTFDQTLRDLMNALDHLQPRGVVVVDDTHPPTYLASLADRDHFFSVKAWLESGDQRWMGDVFKLVWFVDTFMPGLTFRTISNNHGQTVFWRTQRGEHHERTYGRMAELDFEAMVLEEDVLRLERYGEIRKLLRRDLGL